ncbi:MAG: DUF4214 domain-containing protein, partial [Clostridia bacterium]|nr:DUF4214 domain-containing protein [Clostridia bacterium]
YNMILGREADEAGENYWFGLLSEEKISTTEAVSGFIFSGEFAGKSLNTRQQMAVVGETMETNQEDMSTWSAALEQGSTLAEAINGLGASNEFDDLRSRFDFDSDYASSEDLRTDLIQLRAFVARCYDAFLGREADDAGMNAWAEPFASGKKTAAEIIGGFVFSEEFTARNLSSEDIVKALYKTMLNRTADEAGLKQWAKALDNGEPLESVINGIAQSDEFIQLCKACGIRPGFLPVGPEPAPEPEPEDQWDAAKITAFIRRAYREALDRDAGEEELAHWVSQVMSKEISPAKAARMILVSQEMEARSLGNEAFVKVMYKVFLDRDADPDGLIYWQAKLEGEEVLTRVALMREFCNSKEYKDYQDTLKK